jgi:hypothetical protein
VHSPLLVHFFWTPIPQEFLASRNSLPPFWGILLTLPSPPVMVSGEFPSLGHSLLVRSRQSALTLVPSWLGVQVGTKPPTPRCCRGTRYKNCSRLTPQTMTSVDTLAAASQHPYLPCPPRVKTMANGLGWLLYVWPRLGGTKLAVIVEKCVWRLILLVFCP